MKIYFAGSIRGGRDDKDLYLEIIKLLGKYGIVLTEHVGDQNLSAQGESSTEQFIYKRDMSWLTEADIVVAEVSTPSLGVGYELGKAEDMKKSILCLYREQPEKRLSAMLTGNDQLHVKTYAQLADVENIFKSFFNA